MTVAKSHGPAPGWIIRRDWPNATTYLDAAGKWTKEPSRARHFDSQRAAMAHLGIERCADERHMLGAFCIHSGAGHRLRSPRKLPGGFNASTPGRAP